MEESNDPEIIVFIISEQKYGTIVSNGAHASLIKYPDGEQEITECFDNSDFIVSNEIILEYTRKE